MTYTRVRRSVAILIGLALIAHVLLVLPLPVAWRGAAAELLLGLPGILVALWLFGSERDPLLLGFLGLCGGIALQVLLLLALHSLPGPLLWWLVLLPCDTLSGLIFWMLLRQPADS